jgi:5-epi-alpha-selinene synthase
MTVGVSIPVPSRATIAKALFCPFPRRINVHVEDAHQHSVEWAQRFEIVKSHAHVARLRAARMAWMMAGFYPEASRHALELAADYLCWAFILDDVGDESDTGRSPTRLADLLQHLERVLDGASPSASDDHAARALIDLVERLGRLSSSAHVRAFIEANRAYFGGMLWEANNRAGLIVPDEASFSEFRPPAGAVPPALALIEPLERIALPPGLLQDPAVRPLLRMTGNVMCWINDALSFEKECLVGDVHNLPTVLARAHNLSMGEAVWRTVRMSNEEVRAFMASEARLPSFGPDLDTELRRYCAVLRSMMKTTLDWTIESPRYGTQAAIASA